MISFYFAADGTVFFKDDRFLASAFFSIDRPATADDIALYSNEYAAFVDPIEAPTI